MDPRITGSFVPSKSGESRRFSGLVPESPVELPRMAPDDLRGQGYAVLRPEFSPNAAARAPIAGSFAQASMADASFSAASCFTPPSRGPTPKFTTRPAQAYWFPTNGAIRLGTPVRIAVRLGESRPALPRPTNPSHSGPFSVGEGCYGLSGRRRSPDCA
jgi:hypothetical protein